MSTAIKVNLTEREVFLNAYIFRSLFLLNSIYKFIQDHRIFAYLQLSVLICDDDWLSLALLHHIISIIHHHHSTDHHFYIFCFCFSVPRSVYIEVGIYSGGKNVELVIAEIEEGVANYNADKENALDRALFVFFFAFASRFSIASKRARGSNPKFQWEKKIIIRKRWKEGITERNFFSRKKYIKLKIKSNTIARERKRERRIVKR